MTTDVMTPSDAPSATLKRDEAEKFSLALIKTQRMLSAFADLLAKVGDTPDAEIAKINAFIQSKAKNGVADYNTDFETVLEVQQAMQLYQLLYWNAFYKVKVVAADKSESDGPSFVIAATLDPNQPVHVGIGRDQVIAPTFKSLILNWVKSDVQQGSGKLIFNLIPDKTGQFQRSFTGSWVLEDGTAQTVYGMQADPKEVAKDKDKFTLPPALQVIYPTIAALGAIGSLVGGVVGMLWIRKQWKEKNELARQREAAARDNPGDAAAQRGAEDAGRARDAAAGAVRDGAPVVADQGDAVGALPPADFDAAVAPVAADPPPLPAPSVVDAGREAAAQAQAAPELAEAAGALARRAEPPALDGAPRSEGGDESSSSVSVDDGALGPGPTVEGE